VLRAGELAGLVVPIRPAVVTTVEDWSQGNPSASRLRRDGFVRGLREMLHARDHDGVSGYSFVVEFRTAAGAGDQVASDVGSVHAPAPTYVAFRVAGIPDAHGWTTSGPGQVSHNVMFSDGRFQYWVGLVSPPAVTLPLEAQVIAAARSLYRRVHGR
jgi:hypothetical protein